MGLNTFIAKDVSTVFVVQNISQTHKTINLFGLPLGYRRSYDLLSIPEISEADIRHSLLKGELKSKATVGDIRVIRSTIDLTQYDSQQREFLASIGITSGVAGTPQEHIYYVGKHGGDSNNGLTAQEAFLTFSAAVATAAAQTPSSSNRFVIKGLDAGIYAENITLSPFVNIDAPSVTIQGNITVADDTYVLIERLEASSGFGVLKTVAQTGISRFEANTVIATGSARGALNLAPNGVLIYEVKSTYAEDGFAVGDSTQASGHCHIQCEDIYITGSGTALAKSGSGSLVGYVAHILEVGAGIGSGEAIRVVSGEIAIQVNTISMNQAYTLVNPTATLRLIAGEVTGGTTITGGTAYVTTAGYIAGTPGDWAATAPTDLNNAIDRLAAAVEGLLGGPIP